MAAHKQDDLLGKLGQKCKQCGNKEILLTSQGICQRCDYNNIFGKNINKEQWDYQDEKSLKELFRKMDDGRYIYKRRCSICKEFIEINALDDPYMDKVMEFMDRHAKKHIDTGKGFVHAIEDYTIDK